MTVQSQSVITVEPQPTVHGEVEPPELVPGNLRVGSRLLAAATVFAFLGPFFAFFYLRALNTAHMWRPAGVNPPQAYGAAIVALFAISAAILAVAPRLVEGRGWRWRPLVGLSLGLGLAGVALQCAEYFNLRFGPESGGYASVFVGWTALTAVLALGAMVALETLLAYGLRHRDAPPLVVQPRLAALGFYWSFFAGLSVVMWATLYLVK
jgi:heme/copper-type cytochrome/quinol oxidase subunit 3